MIKIKAARRNLTSNPAGGISAEATIWALIRRVRYLTLYQWSSGGPKFAVFASEAEP
jgi:hypothetical protein